MFRVARLSRRVVWGLFVAHDRSPFLAGALRTLSVGTPLGVACFRTSIFFLVSMSEFAGPQTEYECMAQLPRKLSESDESAHLTSVRVKLLKSAVGGTNSVPAMDVEDVVQDALLKLGRRGELGDVTDAYAFSALRDARAEFYKRSARRQEDPSADIESTNGEVVAIGSLAPGAAIREYDQLVTEIAGKDAACYVALTKAHGYTEAEVASLKGWNRRRAGAARKQFERKRGEIMKAIMDCERRS